MAQAPPDYTFKYQFKWLKATLKEGRMVPICFKKENLFVCTCIDSTYGQPDPMCKICFGTGYTNQQEVHSRKWVMALIAPVDQETIERFPTGTFTQSSRMALISYPVSQEFTALYDIQPTMTVEDADGVSLTADLGFIVRPQDKEAEIVYKQKLWNGQEYQVDERKFVVVSVESYIVSEFPIGQKLIIEEKKVISSHERFIPEQ